MREQTIIDPDALVRALHIAQHGHLERRYCEAGAPMKYEDKDRFMWGHPDAQQVGTFLNLTTYLCPHCGLRFNCLPRSS
jgi:hypothetical protein